MGVIKDIVDKVVPKAQKRIEDDGISIKDALHIEFKEIGYIPEKTNKLINSSEDVDGGKYNE